MSVLHNNIIVHSDAQSEEAGGTVKIAQMYYSNFDKHVTERYGILMKGWPLPKFCNPSEVGSKVELEVLHNAWETGRAYFERLLQSDWDTWCHARFQALLVITTGSDNVIQPGTEQTDTMSVDSSLSSSISANDIPAPDIMPMEPPAPVAVTQARAPLAPVTTASFLNFSTVTGANGEAIITSGKQRKQRKDKGLKRKKT